MGHLAASDGRTGWIDLHCHIIPGVDDGPQTLDESLEMIALAAESGTAVMVATPHRNSPVARIAPSSSDSTPAGVTGPRRAA